MILTCWSYSFIMLNWWTKRFLSFLSPKRIKKVEFGSKNWFGLLCLQAYSFSSCHAWMWHHFLIVWSWKGYNTEKVQDKFWASKGNWGLWFNPLNIKPNCISWWKCSSDYVWSQNKWVIENSPLEEILQKIGYQSSTYWSKRPSTHFSSWQISQLQSLLPDMPMEKLWMRHVAQVLGLDSYNTCFIIIVTTLQACKLSKIAFNIQTKTSKVA